MKYVERKAFYDYEKEENYINEMCNKGFALVDYSWCRYVFEDCKQGEYIYRIELLDNKSNHPESIRYIRFLEEMGIDLVAVYMRWIYLRKKATEGEFEIYSDIDSKIKYHNKIYTFWNTFVWLEFIAAGLNILIFLIGMFSWKDYSYINLQLGIVCFCLGFIFYRLSNKNKNKVKFLSKEKSIRE